MAFVPVKLLLAVSCIQFQRWETLAAIPLVRALRHRHPSLLITVTTMTPTGSERVQSAFGKDVHHVYLPYDLPAS